MYTPPFNRAADDDDLRAMVAACRSAWLVTVSPGGAPAATLLPIMWQGDVVIAHMAKANQHWRDIADDSPGLLIVSGPEAYITPSWYPAKAEHGRVVPTWNYLAAQLTGTVRVHHDREWLRRAVTELTDLHEAGRNHQWYVTDAPEPYVDGQLGGIVGLEFTVTKAEGKAKLSQNRSDADQRGVVTGLRAEPLPAADRAQAVAIADAMERRLQTRPDR